MFSSYFDIVIMRTVEPDFAERCAYMMNDLDQFNERSVPVVNGGSGADEHPTQALLDLYTIQRSFQFEDQRDSSTWSRLQDLQSRHSALTPGLQDKRYTFCGDIGRSRTIRSLAVLLSRYPSVTMRFVSPDHPKMRLQGDLRSSLVAAGVRVEEYHDLADALSTSDLLYMTRIQSEHDSDSDARSMQSAIAASNCRLTQELLNLLPEYAPIMHPFPRNQEIPTSIDSDPRAMYFRQARNGMWMRAALLAHLFDVDGRIASRYASESSVHHNYNTQVL
jgi:aspartate carbamoyltransferase catalytic subunit